MCSAMVLALKSLDFGDRVEYKYTSDGHSHDIVLAKRRGADDQPEFVVKFDKSDYHGKWEWNDELNKLSLEFNCRGNVKKLHCTEVFAKDRCFRGYDYANRSVVMVQIGIFRCDVRSETSDATKRSRSDTEFL